VHGLQALIAAHRDDRATLDRQLALFDDLLPGMIAHHDDGDDFRKAQALVAERTGQIHVALDVLASSVRRRDSGGHDRDLQYDLATVVRLAVAAGDREIARWATERCDREAELVSGPFVAAAAHHCHGLLDTKAADLRLAVDGYRAIGATPALAGGLEDLAVVHGMRGEVQDALTAYAEAVELYQGLGAVCDLARARSRVRPYGVGGGPHGDTRPAFGWYALTPTERRIARLVADGLSNPDIAAELFLSRRTVQSHVSHILAKLDVRSRAEIAKEAARHPEATAPTGG
jgi:DNA-binding CsgD family transcriptional regulator